MNAQVLTTTRSAAPGSSVGLQPVGEQRADQLVGVDLVLRAAERLDVEALRHVDQATDGTRPAPPSVARQLLVGEAQAGARPRHRHQPAGADSVM